MTRDSSQRSYIGDGRDEDRNPLREGGKPPSEELERLLIMLDELEGVLCTVMVGSLSVV